MAIVVAVMILKETTRRRRLEERGGIFFCPTVLDTGRPKVKPTQGSMNDKEMKRRDRTADDLMMMMLHDVW